MGIENELSQICAMIESGKLCYADAVYYLTLAAGMPGEKIYDFPGKKQKEGRK